MIFLRVVAEALAVFEQKHGSTPRIADVPLVRAMYVSLVAQKTEIYEKTGQIFEVEVFIASKLEL